MTKAEKKFLTDEANFLRSIGVKVTFKGNRKSSPQQRSAVSKYAAIYGGYKQKGEAKIGDRNIFVPLTKAKRQAFKGIVTEQQITPRGVILVVPRGESKKSFKFSVKGEGSSAYLETKISKDRTDAIVSLNELDLAGNPVKACINALAKVHPNAAQLKGGNLLKGLAKANAERKRIDKKRGKKQKKLPIEIKLVIGGNEQHQSNDFGAFFKYFTTEFLEDTDESNRHGRRGQKIDTETVARIFQLKLIYKTSK